MTHGYHSYPAKFIPQIVSKLIDEYSKEGEIVSDIFGGCGTTMLESKLKGRSFHGVDINPVAVLISKAKKDAINPTKLDESFVKLINKAKLFNSSSRVKIKKNERIDYWFTEVSTKKLSYLLREINKIEDSKQRIFFQCAFSNILKSSSMWLQKSNKPTKDFKKVPRDPFILFEAQCNMMLKKNREFFEISSNLKKNKTFCKIECADARSLPMKDTSIDLLITSPPYSISYEYADLHQLSALWFDYSKNLKEFRKRFIGTSYSNRNKKTSFEEEKIEKILNKFSKKDKRAKEQIDYYFDDMRLSFKEMHRVLKKNKFVCIVIGDTKIKQINIFNSRVFVEQLENLGFSVKKVIKRRINSKNLPSIRDKKTGRFASLDTKSKIYSYKYEYILIAQKI